jgi:N6-L-threonylcarbamoyladenine synthase
MPTTLDNPVILAVETSCDDTSVAVLRGSRVLSNIVSSQIHGLHFGGIVQELASRAHQANMIPVTREALEEAGVKKNEIGLVAVTYGPGLVGSLLVGLNFSKSLSYALNIPFIGVNHIEAHILASFLEYPELEFPFVALTVSGGHTILVYARGLGDYSILGETQDDAAGECFDKVARLLNLQPDNGSAMGGPIIDRRARSGDPQKIKFPRPMIRSGDYHFSFSGLKTSVLNYLTKCDHALTDPEINDVCASFQEAATDVLAEKTIKACGEMKCGTAVLSGGVAANSRLRTKLGEATQLRGIRLIVPSQNFCTDNAAMIGMAGYLNYRQGRRSPLELAPKPSLRLVL